jgi:ABC-type transport system substrate-binding protein
VRSLCLLLAVWSAAGATRPKYGGTLRVEMRQAVESPDLAGAFNLRLSEAGRRVVLDANENAAGGRPFLDTVEVTMGRALREQSLDLELGRADVIELGPAEMRRQVAGRKVWSSAPVRVLALVFSGSFEDARVREALALAVDRAAIHTVLLQRQGEVSGALLPQWLSGFAFTFPTAPDLARARTLAAGAKPLTLGVEDPALRPIADRIALNARDAGLSVTFAVVPNVLLRELQVISAEPALALAAMGSTLGLPQMEPGYSPESLYRAERHLLEGFRVIPLIHLPDVYGAGPRVHGAPGISPLGEWRFENLWLEGGRP